MDMIGVRNLKYISLPNVKRKLNKNNANDDNTGEDDFDAINSRLKKKKPIEFKNDEPNSKRLPIIPPIVNGQNTCVLSNQREDSWKRAMLFIDQKQ